MRLTFTCSVCKKENYLKEKASTRPNLQMQIRGDEVHVNCKFCGKRDKKHINRITAVVDNRIIGIGIIVGIVISLILIYFFGFIAAIILSIPILVWRNESDNAHKFNSYAIKRK